MIPDNLVNIWRSRSAMKIAGIIKYIYYLYLEYENYEKCFFIVK